MKMILEYFRAILLSSLLAMIVIALTSTEEIKYFFTTHSSVSIHSGADSLAIARLKDSLTGA